MNLHTLNDAQREAVTFFEKRPLVVMAGPGTGKTRVLTERVAFLMEEKAIAPEEILAITFTNHAAREMSERIATLCKASPRVTTFHAWAYELIKEEMGQEAPCLIDEVDAYELFREGLHTLGLGTKGARRLFKEVALMRQSYPEKIPVEDAKATASYHAYKALLYKYNVMDFDDLLVRCMKLLEQTPTLGRVKAQWPHILVDEFQDVNPIQFEIVETISTGHLTIIGDPNQSIYGFRGSDPKAMERFLERHGDAKVVRLTVAYRCPQVVLDCAGAVLTKGTGQMAPLRSQKGDGTKVVLRGFQTPREEAKWIVDKIESLTGAVSFEAMNFAKAPQPDSDTYDLGQLAILLRTRAPGGNIAEGLRRRGVPYLETKATPITEEPTARLLARLVALARGLKQEFHKRRLQEEANLDEALVDECVDALMREDIDRVFKLLDLDQDDPFTRQLARWITISPHPYLSTDVDLLGIDGLNALHLMTIHGAKGLEFPVVFIPRCEHEILPMKGADEGEERRLFYVATTRAKERLYITYCTKRKSPFLRDLPEETYLEEVLRVQKKMRGKRKGPRQGTLF